MGRHVETALFCLISMVWIQHTLSDGPGTSSDTNKWTCTCSISHQQTINFVLQNCTSSCECSPAEGGSSEYRWTCICNTSELPRLISEGNDSTCFTACNCNTGASSELEPSKKRNPVKAVFIVLFVCLILAAIALVSVMLWHAYWKEKHTVEWVSSSSDMLTSCSTSSAVNLRSHASSPMPVYKGYLDSSTKPFIGCIPRTSFAFRGRTKALHGTIVQFSYSELENATNRFSDTNLVGVGGSSCVYRGNLRDGRIVAVKRMKPEGNPDEEHVFLSEIKLIARLHHCHLVPLLGYCLEQQGKNAERLLVFEYIPNGNVRECLDGDLGKSLDWNTRVSIALGAARGLEYLHDAAAPRILHRDVKSTNILLDENWRAKITDLGMAKHIPNDGLLSCSNSPDRMQGTFGYFAPEYAIVGRASSKSDVFSFGVVLLELITGRKPINEPSNKGPESLVIWATPRLHDSKKVIQELPDPRLEGKFQEEEMQVMAYLAKECLLLDPDSRPTMSEVVQILSTIAPDRSKRSNMPRSTFQCGMRGEASSSTEEIKQITFEMPLKNDSEKEGDDSSSDMEKLMLLSSRKGSRGSREDEVVDLAEPRFEAFCLPNVDSHQVTFT